MTKDYWKQEIKVKKKYIKLYLFIQQNGLYSLFNKD
jgi:hypothetical protein